MGLPEPVQVSPSLLRRWPLPSPGQDKEERGCALVVGGSRRTPGAVLLAAEAALRAGAGKVQVVTVASVATAVAVALPEALVAAGPETAAGELAPAAAEVVLELATRAACVLVGPGIMHPPAARALLQRILPDLDVALVLDALALARLAQDPDAVRHLGGRCVLTPNEGEVALALGVAPGSLTGESAGAALRLARSAGAVVSAGGSTTWTATPEGRLWRDAAGGPGLGVSGSGDVKAGIVLGLRARGAAPAQAAVWGGYLHARSGDRLAARTGTVGFLARELPAQVPHVLSEVEARRSPGKRGPHLDSSAI